MQPLLGVDFEGDLGSTRVDECSTKLVSLDTRQIRVGLLVRCECLRCRRGPASGYRKPSLVPSRGKQSDTPEGSPFGHGSPQPVDVAAMSFWAFLVSSPPARPRPTLVSS